MSPRRERDASASEPPPIAVKQAPLLIGLLKLIAGAPAMPGHAEIERVERRLRLDLDCRAATAFFERRIDDALNSHSHRIAGILHRYAMSQKE